MKIQVSKIMANQIANACKERSIKVDAVYVAYTSSATDYRMNIASIGEGTDYAYCNGDYDCKRERFKFICIEYPTTYYAPARLLTTYQLIGIALRCRRAEGGIELKDFMDELCREIEI